MRECVRKILNLPFNPDSDFSLRLGFISQKLEKGENKQALKMLQSLKDDLGIQFPDFYPKDESDLV